MAKIFLSYSRNDQLPASNLAKDLRDLGHAVWMDQELTGGQAWWDQILANIRACELFVFVLSSASLYSTACQREYGYAADLNRPILPVLVRDGLSSSVLPPALSQVQFLDFRARHVEAIIALARALQSLPLGQPLPDPLPAPPEVPLSYLASLSLQIESPATLSLAEQSRLVLELKSALRDSTTRQDARTLWARLRARRDLLATIAEEMDEVVVRGPKRSSRHLAVRALLGSMLGGLGSVRRELSPRSSMFSGRGSDVSPSDRTASCPPRGEPPEKAEIRRVSRQPIGVHRMLWCVPILNILTCFISAAMIRNLWPLVIFWGGGFLFYVFATFGWFIVYGNWYHSATNAGEIILALAINLIGGCISANLTAKYIQKSKERLWLFP
jgi:hypothetical protein